MFIIGELFQSLAFLVSGICQLLYWLLMARIIISWFPVDPFHQIVQFLLQVTDPLLKPFRRLPLQLGMLDLSPIFAFFFLFLINRILVATLARLAVQFGAAS